MEKFISSYTKQEIFLVRSGDTIKIHQKIREGDKERVQAFEGMVIARKHGKSIGATITVRKIVAGVGVEKIYPLHSPTIDRIEILHKGKVRRAKLYYLRTAKNKRIRTKTEKN